MVFFSVQNTLQEQQINTSSPGKLKNKSFFSGLLMIARHLQIRKSSLHSLFIFFLSSSHALTTAPTHFFSSSDRAPYRFTNA